MDEADRASDADRRDFLKAAGKFAVVAPPAITALLSTTMASNAIAQSYGGKGNEGCGNGPDPDPSPSNPDTCPPPVPTDPP